MTFGDKLSKKRKENNYTQEQFAELIGVSRQSVSKWESDIAYPETDKLIRISELFGCSLDYLMKDTEETETHKKQDNAHNFFKISLHEKKSDKTILGMPLWHIGKQARGFIAVGLNAGGVIAIGLKATGVVSLGMLSVGLISFGMFSLGLLSIGMFAFGILSAGCFSVGIFTAGAISLGIISVGAVTVGDFSVGALAVGKYFALGDNARAMVALGKTEATGTVFRKIGDISEQDIAAAIKHLEAIVPTYLSWAKEIIQFIC